MGENMEKINGYILKFYKKIKHLKKGNESFHFVSFMNFDGVRIIPVKNFKDYQKNTIDFKKPLDDDQDCSRQKLLIYNFEDDFSNLVPNKEDIFDKKKSTFSKKYPILAITIINLKRGTNQKQVIQTTQSILREKDIKYKFFGSLSINDLVIVYRCKNFSDLFECNFYSLFPQSDFFHSTYTIPCLLLSCAKFWKEAEGLEISIRSSIPPKDTYFNTPSEENLSINGKHVLGLKQVTKYDVFGKYDIDIRGTIDSSNEFVKNFTNGLFFEKPEEINQIKRNTNTRFLYKCTTNDCETISYVPELVNDNITKFKTDISQLCSDIINGSQSNSSDYNHNLARLWLRAYQLLLRGRDNPILDDIIDIIKSYFELVYVYVNKLDYSESIIAGLKSLNTLIDNRDLNDFYEFENPHSNLMFSGCCTSLLSAYSNMANIAFKKIARLNNETKKYLAYITSDGYAEVSAKEMFTGNNKCFLINIRIPTELMFDFKNLVCFILHEIGHNWNCLSDKEEYFSRIFLETLLRLFIDKNSEQYDLPSDDDINDIVQFTINENLKQGSIFSSIAETLAITLYDNKFCKKIEDAYKISQTINYNLEQLFAASEEAKADIFMIKCIGIKSPEFYLNIVVDYLNYKNIDYSSTAEYYKEIMLNVFIRVLVVLIFLLAEDDSEVAQTFFKIIDELGKYFEKAKKQFDKDSKNTTAKTKIDFISQLLSLLKDEEETPPVFLYAYKIYSEVLCPIDHCASEFREKFDFTNDTESLEIQKNFEEYLNKGNDEDGFKAIINFINSINQH